MEKDELMGIMVESGCAGWVGIITNDQRWSVVLLLMGYLLYFHEIRVEYQPYHHHSSVFD